MRKVIGYALLAFAAVSVAFAVFQETRPAPQAGTGPGLRGTAEAAPAPVPATPAAARRSPRPKAAAVGAPVSGPVVIARYCHGRARCSNCVKIEQYSREAIETGLREELDSGRLRFETVNVEEPENRHYVQEYGLYTKSLVLVSQTGGKEGRHKVLNGVWDRLGDKEAFMEYVKSETEGFLR